MSGKFEAHAVRTRYWRPGTDYVREVVNAVREFVRDGDVVAVSEKAVSTASGNILDESLFKPSPLSKLLVVFWMRFVWGFFLGRLCRLRRKTIRRLRNYPLYEGAVHKQVALRAVGLLQALRHYSEGGIDGSNLPYSYVSLPLRDASKVADEIRRAILDETGKKVTVMIVDGDTTYTVGGLHLAPRKVDVEGLVHFGGFLTFVLGRALGGMGRATPIAVSGSSMTPEDALEAADTAHRAMGPGAGRTVWDMARRFGTTLTGVTWEMLESVEHRPVVVLRRVNL